MSKARPVVLVLGPSANAVSGVATHVSLLRASQLSERYSLVHYQVGSEGHKETHLGKLARLAFGPLRLAAAIARHDASIVHINWSLNQKAYWRDLGHMAVAKLCNTSVIFQKHGGHLAEFTRNPLFAAFVKASFRLADVIVVLSQAELEEYRRFSPGQNIASVPNGVDPALYLDRARPARDPGAPLHLLYIGRLASHKGVAETLDALVLARASGVKPRLTIAGSGPEEARLRNQVCELGLADQVTFAGAVAGERKTALLCGADVLLLASYTEGLPYSLLEGMAAGLVPIVTPVGAVPEVVGEAQAHIVPMKDPSAIAQAIVALHADRARLARMSEACRQRIRSAFTLERLGADFGWLYASLASRPARGLARP